MDSEEIQENITSMEYVLDGLETAIDGLKEIDRKMYKEEIGTLTDLKNFCEMDLKDLEDQLEEQEEIEEKEYEEEMKAMNWEFERSRI